MGDESWVTAPLALEVVQVVGEAPWLLRRGWPSRGSPLRMAGYDPSQRVEGDRILVKPSRRGRRRPPPKSGRRRASSPSIGGRRVRPPRYRCDPRTFS
jgi:hypothetical protein